MKKVYSFMLFAMLGASVMASGETLHKLVIDPAKAHAAVKPQVPVKKSSAAASQSRAEDEEWTYVGTGKYTDDILTNSGVPSATWEVEIYESASTPGFYRVENPFGNGNCPKFPEKFESCDFLLHAENPDAVWMEYVEMKNIDFGLLEGEYCPAFIGDMAGYYIGEGYFDAETAVSMGMCAGKMWGGNITFEEQGLIMSFPYYEDGLDLAANTNGLFKVSLPGAKDYTFNIKPESICVSETLTFNYETGDAVQEVKYGIFDGIRCFMTDYSEYSDRIAAEGKVAADGVINVEPVYGANTFIAVALENGEIVGKELIYCYGQQEQPDKWKNIGKAEYSEDVLFSVYPEYLASHVYEVDIQESVTTPGRYRLVDLYGPAYPEYDYLVGDENILTGHDHHHYVIVDATNPERVFIEPSPLGMDFGYGEVTFFSEGYLSMLRGEDMEDPLVIEGFGTLADGKITFLGGALYLYMPDYGLPRGNINHKFYIKLPGTVSIDSVNAESGEAEYYNISGLKVTEPAAAGIYIRKIGDRTEKIYVK